MKAIQLKVVKCILRNWICTQEIINLDMERIIEEEERCFELNFPEFLAFQRNQQISCGAMLKIYRRIGFLQLWSHHKRHLGWREVYESSNPRELWKKFHTWIAYGPWMNVWSTDSSAFLQHKHIDGPWMLSFRKASSIGIFLLQRLAMKNEILVGILSYHILESGFEIVFFLRTKLYADFIVKFPFDSKFQIILSGKLVWGSSKRAFSDSTGNSGIHSSSLRTFHLPWFMNSDIGQSKIFSVGPIALFPSQLSQIVEILPSLISQLMQFSAVCLAINILFQTWDDKFDSWTFTGWTLPIYFAAIKFAQSVSCCLNRHQSFRLNASQMDCIERIPRPPSVVG